MAETTRREFLAALASSAAATAFAPALYGAAEIRMGLIVPADHPAAESVVAGARLGAKEAKWTAGLMKQTFRLDLSTVNDAREAATEATRMRRHGVTAIAGGVSAACCEAIADAAPANFIEIRDRREVSAAGEHGKHLRATPSYDQYARALLDAMKRQGLEKNSALTAGVTLEQAPGTAVPLAWHPELFRYGAGELNERYVDATGEGMNEDAWFGWVATKVVLETALRNQRLRDARIDGHKGVPLTFENGILRQPLYVALHGKDEVEVVHV